MEKGLSIVLPISNELANILTSSGFHIFRNLYMDNPRTSGQKLSRAAFDFLAISGIILNAVKAGEKYGKKIGVIKGIGVLVIAFMVPNLTLHPMMNILCGKCGHKRKLFVGILLLLILIAFEITFDYLLKKNNLKKGD